MFISTAVSVQPVFHKNEINELSDLVTQSLFDIESIMDGDYSSLLNYNASNSGVVSTTATTGTGNSSTPPAPNFNIPSVPGIGEDQAEEIFTRHSSIVSNQPNNNEIDELYTSFVNVATIKEPDLSLLARWVEKINNGGSKLPEQPFTPVVKYKISKIFLLSITNLKISDSFLELFYNLLITTLILLLLMMISIIIKQYYINVVLYQRLHHSWTPTTTTTLTTIIHIMSQLTMVLKLLIQLI